MLAVLSRDAGNKLPILRYCGLFMIKDARLESGKDGHKVCLFDFEPCRGQSLRKTRAVLHRRTVCLQFLEGLLYVSSPLNP